MIQEAYEIRKEINRLRGRLRELEHSDVENSKPEICASSVCAHDEIISNLKKMCRTFGHSSRAVVAGWEKRSDMDRERWFSTTVYPECLPYFIRNPENVTTFLHPLASDGAFAILELMFVARDPIDEKRITNSCPDAKKTRTLLGELIQAGHVDEDRGWYSLSMKGWQTYIVLAHLTNVLDLKLDAKKAIAVSKAVSELYGIGWGEYLGRSYDEVKADLDEAGMLAQLYEQGIEDADLEKAVYEYNAPVPAA